MRFSVCVLGLLALAAPAVAGQDENAPIVLVAQQPKPGPSEGQQVTPKPTPVQVNEPAPPRAAQLANVRLEVTITDQRANAQPTTKTVALVLADRANGRIRTTGEVRVDREVKMPGGVVQTASQNRSVVLNVDAHPEFMRDGRVRANVTLEYRPTGGEAEKEEPALTTISETFAVILDDGKPLLVSQSADPTTDRRVRVEIKATILK